METSDYNGLDKLQIATIVVGNDGLIKYASPKLLEMFGYIKDELIGKAMEMLLPQEVRERHVGHRAGYYKHPSMRMMGERLNLHGMCKNGEEFPVKVGLNSFKQPDGTLDVMATIVDLTESQ